MCSSFYIFLSVIFLFQSYLPLCDSIKCYHCTIVGPPQFHNETKKLCSEFDYSDRYIVDCPYSTFCMKKMYTVNLQSNVINGTSRGCASQTNVIQNYEGGRWQKKILIEEPYTEGCTDADDKGQRSSKTSYCYCKGDLCNGSFKPFGHFYFNILAVIVILYVSKKLFFNLS